MSIFFIIILFIIPVICIDGFLIEPNLLSVKKYIIKDKVLKGLKLVFVSDFHITKHQEKRLKKIIELINEQNADIVLSTGDYIAKHSLKASLDSGKIAENISKIKSNYGFYTTLGNHDWKKGEESITSAFQKYGIKILKNENIPVKFGERIVYIAGIEDYQSGRPSIQTALSNTENPVILLTHNPDMFTEVPDSVNLTLAGHTHGGQINLPIFGALIIPSKYRNRFASGYIEENGKKMIVTKGIGTSIIPVRINCKPEIVVIEFED